MSLRIIVTLCIDMAKIGDNYSRVLAIMQNCLRRWRRDTAQIFSILQTDKHATAGQICNLNPDIGGGGSRKLLPPLPVLLNFEW